ncbi:SCO7613 C-terminal domain-containing membrane protein [Paramicrobacterium chengjingii]|uniref:Uncharacterized protein n=1 Tax=Paramicrobacterium chengjingii TaxID=2769067 RepID=A0ABX6YF68_9MICO|nr:hypothetical protein [Microbacterium chengjingii]QPZ37050.1 hypothetical protein HCR76_09155 [Microbacterium chengjingii]
MTGDAQRIAPGGPRRRRLTTVLGSVGIAISSCVLVLVLAAAVPAIWHIPLSLCFASGLAATVRLATRRGRRLFATVCVFASLLPLVFSQWSVRQSGLAIVSDLHVWAFIATVNGALAVLLFTAARITRTRTYTPVGAIAAAVALLGIGISLFPFAAPSSRAWAGMLLVAYASAVWPLFRRSRSARITVRAVAAIASVLVLALAATTWPSLTWGTSLAFLITSGAFALHLLWSPVATTERDNVAPKTMPIQVLSDGPTLARELGAWKAASAVGLGLAVSGAAAAPVVHFTSFARQIDVAACLTALGAIVFATLSWRYRHHRSAPGFRVAGLVTLVVCASSVIPAIGIGVIETWSRIALPNFSVSAVSEHTLAYPAVSPYIWISPAVLTIATAMSLHLWGRLGALSWLPLALGGVTLMIAHATALTVVASVVSSCVLAVSATALFIVLRPRRGRRVVLITLAFLGAASSFVVGANSADVWPVAAIVALGALSALRIAVPRRVGRTDRLAIGPVMTASIVVLLIFTARWIPLWAPTSFASPSAASALATVIAASAILVVTSIFGHRLVSTEAAAMSVLSALASVVGIAGLATLTAPAAQRDLVVGLACVLVAELSWQVARREQHSVARYVTAVLTPPTAVLLAVVSWRHFGPAIWGAPELLAVSISAVLAGAGILLFRDAPSSRGEPRSHPARLGWDSSIALTSIVTVPAALTTSEFGSLNLIMLGVLPVLFALGEGSLTRSTRRRKNLVWACIPPFGGAVWLTLSSRGTAGVELYALAMAALVCAALAVVASRRPSPQAPVPPGRNLLTIGTLAVFLVPSVAVSHGGSVGQAALVLLLATVLACLGAFLPPLIRGIHLALWLWSAGLLTVTFTTVIRSFDLVAHAAGTFGELLAWSVCGAALLTIFAALWLRRRQPQVRPAYAALASAPLVLSLPIANLVAVAEVPWWMLVVVSLGTTSFLSYPHARGSRAHDLVSWMTTLGAAFLAVGTITGGHTAVEFVSVPAALLAIAVNLRVLREHAQATSVRVLGVPLGVLILPSLVQCLTDPAPLRIAWLVICIALTAAFGVMTRLKAPIVAAGIAALVVVLTLVWPAVTLVASGWAAVLVLAGLLIIATVVVRLSGLPIARALRGIAQLR